MDEDHEDDLKPAARGNEELNCDTLTQAVQQVEKAMEMEHEHEEEEFPYMTKEAREWGVCTSSYRGQAVLLFDNSRKPNANATH